MWYRLYHTVNDFPTIKGPCIKQKYRQLVVGKLGFWTLFRNFLNYPPMGHQFCHVLFNTSLTFGKEVVLLLEVSSLTPTYKYQIFTIFATPYANENERLLSASSTTHTLLLFQKCTVPYCTTSFLCVFKKLFVL